VIPGVTPPADPGTAGINAPAEVFHPIDTLDDSGTVVADFDSNKPNAVFRITQVVDNATGLAVTGKYAAGSGDFASSGVVGADPATDPWFYLDTSSGKVYLTAAGAAAQCIGTSYTLTVQAVADGVPGETGTVTFKLAAPTTGEGDDLYADLLTGLTITDAASGYDVLQVHQGSANFTQMQVLAHKPGELAEDNSLYIQVGNNFAQVVHHFDDDGGAGPTGLDYISFTGEGNYYSYDFGTASDLSYYHVAPGESTEAVPTVTGTNCNDVLYGGTVAGYTETFNGGAGNDLIFGGPLFSGAPGDWDPVTNGVGDVLNGDAGNDLLVGAAGDDILNGGDGNDVLIGGRGHDTLTGGAGADVFVFNAPIDAAHADTIDDFIAGVDKIYLDSTVFGSGALTHLSYVEATGVLSYDTTLLATFTTKPTLALDSTNFIVA
jgi:Ca2+-binding RTX toxin-like protein